MQLNSDHNKLINQAARHVLKEYGLFQKGYSRTWIDDNGWYLTVVEFQPSMWDKGSYLNVGMNFLWDKKDYLSFDYGHRVGSFVSKSHDDAGFYSDMCALAEMALQKVLEYRKFRDLQYARKALIGYPQYLKENRGIYHKMMICGLNGDAHAQALYHQLMERLPLAETDWERAYYRELRDDIAPIIHDENQMREYICGKINVQRGWWHEKPSMKKIREVFSL